MSFEHKRHSTLHIDFHKDKQEPGSCWIWKCVYNAYAMQCIVGKQRMMLTHHMEWTLISDYSNAITYWSNRHVKDAQLVEVISARWNLQAWKLSMRSLCNMLVVPSFICQHWRWWFLHCNAIRNQFEWIHVINLFIYLSQLEEIYKMRHIIIYLRKFNVDIHEFTII